MLLDEYAYRLIEKKKYHTIGTFPNSNIKIVKRQLSLTLESLIKKIW